VKSESKSVTSAASSASDSSLSIGKYDYLAPLPLANTWNPGIITKFVNRYNANLGSGNDAKMLKADTFTTDRDSKNLMLNALEEEAVYYINNGKFPLDTYVSDYLNSNPTAVPESKQGSITVNSKNISVFFTNRIIYMIFISVNESKITPLPESYEIFTGKKTPAASNVASNVSPTSLSPSDIQTLKSICSKY